MPHLDYSTAPTTQPGSGELLPKGLRHWAILTLRPHNFDMGIAETPSKTTDARYLDVEMTLCNGPFDKRKVWDKIGVGGTEKYVQAGMAAIRHILEVGKKAGPTNMVGYQIESYFALDGLLVAVRVGVEKGKDGYEDKNNVRYLSPNPESDTVKDFEALVRGEFMPAPKATPGGAPAQPAWGPSQAPPPPPPQSPAPSPMQAPPAGNGWPSAPVPPQNVAPRPSVAVGGPPTKPAWIG
ncbi:MAG: hypothetical protein A3E78_12025 [Alphaproteobacteria bacterium RIFCSPHIGHO2_12_FULL_63_12]|nr:MAG: hypothetical protein A3E78_12025 [Alphaproteobacteria bacterium RIFCSPHIGHO2_12_FULL_63_12]